MWDEYVSLEPQRPCTKVPQCKCQKQTVITKEKTVVSCRNASLTEVPNQLPNNTVFLDLSINKIKQLGAGNFKGYPKLKTLNVSFNQITEINKNETFEGLGQLNSLSLQNNSIRYNSTGFLPGIFKPLVELKTLNIQQNFTRNDFSGDDYTLEALYDLPNLKRLFLDGIPEKTLGEVFVSLRSLQELTFSRQWGYSRCYLPKLTPNFFPPNTNISKVILTHCEIKMIKAKSFQSLTNLLYLDLSNNEELTFKSMKNISDGLNSTKIHTIKLNKVHKTLGPCVALSVEFLKSLDGLKLTEISLDSNRISTLEEKGIKYIPNTLETVSVRDNIFLLDKYVTLLWSKQTFVNLQKFIISDQSRNHYLDAANDNAGQFKRNKSLHQSVVLSSDNITDAEKHRNSKLPQKKISRSNTKENRHLNLPKSMFNRTIQNKLSHDIKRHIDVDENYKSAQISSFSDAEKIQTEKELDVFIQRKISGWMHGMPIFLPKNFTYLDISNMKIRLKLYKKTLATPNNLRELFLNRNIYWAWYGPFKGFDNLTKLDLSWNSCNYMNLTIFEEMPNLKVLNLSINYLDTSLNNDKNGIIFRHQAKLEVLAISENKLRNLPRNVFSGLKNLKYLHLARNLLKTFDVDLSHLTHLVKVNLHDNQLETINESMRKDFDHHQALVWNFTVNLDKNNFKCDCDNIDFLRWMSESPVRFENIKNYVCYFKDRTVGNLSNAGRIYRTLEKECYNYTPVIVSCTAALVLVISLSAAAIVYRYRWNLRYMYYMAKYKAKFPRPTTGGYEAIRTTEQEFKDVNVSYSDEDCGFIRQKIHEQLEVRRGLTLHIRDRDAPIADVSENILDAIERTKKTLIILSKDYLKHQWCIWEMQMAAIHAMKTDTNMLCVLLLEEVPTTDLPRKIIKTIKDHDHLEYPGEENLQDCFWDRLYAALHSSR